MENLNDLIIKVRSVFVSFLKYFLYGTAIIILCLFLIALALDISSASKLDCLFTSQGIKQLFEVYSTSIQLGTAFLAITALILTIERMRQTRKQFDSMDHNNRFNNFYKHKEEFIKDLSKKTLFIELSQNQNSTPERILSDIYQFYFYKTYFEFEPSLNLGSLLIIDKFYEKLNSSILGNYVPDFDEIGFDELSNIANSYTEHHTIISRYIKGCIEKDPIATIHANAIGDEYNTFLHLCHIYYTCQIILDILSFANLPTKNYNISIFTLSFITYLDKHDFRKLLFLFQ